MTNEEKRNISDYCDSCGEDLGWCPASTNHVCEYYGNHKRGRQIRNENREIVWSYGGNYDDCIYCHEPEERK